MHKSLQKTGLTHPIVLLTELYPESPMSTALTVVFFFEIITESCNFKTLKTKRKVV